MRLFRFEPYYKNILPNRGSRYTHKSDERQEGIELERSMNRKVQVELNLISRNATRMAGIEA